MLVLYGVNVYFPSENVISDSSGMSCHFSVGYDFINKHVGVQPCCNVHNYARQVVPALGSTITFTF